MKLSGHYDSPTTSSRLIMAAGDLLCRLLLSTRPGSRLPLDPDRIKHLLLLRLDGIGDNVCSWPALALLRTQLPRTRITLAVGPWVAPLYHECPWIDELVIWDSGLFGLFRGKGIGSLAEDRRLSRELRAVGYDAGIDLRGDLLSILLLRLAAPAIRIATVTRGGARLLTDPLEIAPGTEVQRGHDIVSATMGIQPSPASAVRDWPRPLALERATKRLNASGWDSSIPAAAICPLALWPWKQWPAERFRELAGRLKNELGLQIIWFLEHPGQAAEYTVNEPVFCAPLDEVAAALSCCRLAISNDSGLMHLAIAAGCPTVQLFGPGDANRFAHRGERIVLHHDVNCRYNPCTRSGECRNLSAGWCLEKISVVEVFASCISLITGNAGDQ